MLDAADRVGGRMAPDAAYAIVAAFVITCLFHAPAAAQATRLQNIELCNGADRTSSEPRIKGCTALILSDSEPPRIRSVAYNNRGNAYIADGAYDRAIADFDKAIEIAPNYAKAFNNRAVAHDKKGQHDLAMRDLEEALKIDAGYAAAFTNRAEIHLAKARFDLAARDFDEAVRLKPSFLAWNGRCQARYALGELQNAYADCSEALRLDRNAAAFDTRGLINLRLGQWDLAISDYSAALQLAPGKATALFGRAVALSRKGEANRAEADYAAAKAVRPTIAEEFARHGVK
jgi:tetratricopeptide (TPR) repeat protein